jgi:phage protein D
MVTQAKPTAAEFGIKFGGAAASADVMDKVYKLEVESNLHLPDVFAIYLHLGEIEEKPFDLVDNLMKDYLSTGKEVEISYKVNGKSQVIVVGEVTSFGLELDSAMPGRPPTAVVRGYDRSHRLHRGRHTRTFLQVSYSDVVKKVAQEAGLQADVDSTSGVHEYVLQCNQTNWDFLWQLARRVGYEIYVDGRKLCFKKPWQARDQVALVWGDSLVQFRLTASTAFQASEVEVRGWDPKKKEAILGKATTAKGNPKLGEAKTGMQQAESAFGSAKLSVVGRPVDSQAEADAVAAAAADAAAGDFVVAEGVTAEGVPALRAGAEVEITKLGSRFSGTYHVTAATHRFSADEASHTSFTVSGRRPHTLLDLMGSEAAGGLPACGAGMVVGVVTNNKDEEDLSRVKVKFPWLDDQVESQWARIVAPGAGKERGMQWLPEVNDEVLVAFEHGDMHRPYVLGGLWSKPDSPPEKNSAIVTSEVNVRKLQSREKLALTISDESGKRSIAMVTGDAAGQIIILQDDKVIEITSNGDIKITGAQGKITVEGKDIEIKSSTNLKIDASANIDITAGGNLTMKGVQATMEASGQAVVKGVQASLEGSAMAKVQGALVQIN